MGANISLYTVLYFTQTNQTWQLEQNILYRWALNKRQYPKAVMVIICKKEFKWIPFLYYPNQGTCSSLMNDSFGRAYLLLWSVFTVLNGLQLNLPVHIIHLSREW